MKNIVLLAGGVGGAKAALGLYQSSHKAHTTIIGNVGDDDAFHNLWVSPDLDTLTYTLAEQVNTNTGWGLKQDSCKTLTQLAALGQDTWMHLGDKDFATHICRTAMRAQGHSMTQVTRHIASSLGVDIPLLPVTDNTVQTRLFTEHGWVAFQEYFVHQRCDLTVSDIAYKGASTASISNEVSLAIANADVIIFAPSNPLLSIAPMLAIPALHRALCLSNAVKIAISPLIGGKAVKGPTEKLMAQMSYPEGNLGIANFYQNLCDILVIDHSDKQDEAAVKALGIQPVLAQTLMTSTQDKIELMEQVVAFASDIPRALAS